ncbi:MAG: hypothetical protein LJE95_13000 [Acidobacteria bacterium]|nr:hypothetical protein [Acidobacteriota bacterium]
MTKGPSISLRPLLLRVVVALRLGAGLALIATLAVLAVVISSATLGVPPTLQHSRWLAGPPWLVALGLGLQGFVWYTVFRQAGRWRQRLQKSD